MKISSINIKNYKSIKDVTIPLQSYGRNKNRSNTAFLLGINESGKSAILQAINLINNGLDDISYQDCCFRDSQDDNEYIEIYVNIDLEGVDFWREKASEILGINQDLLSLLSIVEVQKNYWKDDEADSQGQCYLVKIDGIFPYNEYHVNKGKIQINGINKITETNDIKILTKEILQDLIGDALYDELENRFPTILFWKASDEYLIGEPIELNKFKENPSSCIPLRNIFHICGLTSNTLIKNTIDKALTKQERIDELQNRMTDKLTCYINKVWKEHKIKIRVSINSGKCAIQIEEKDKEYNYFTMTQRSDGFKQFISLILSLSAENESQKLSNAIILIDEPEVHLHPSGVKYMRDELLKLGFKNHVLVSTHSHYMVDTNTPERHWIVKKEKAETNIYQIRDSESFYDDLVTSQAFGLNLYKELLPEDIIIVEGDDDKIILQHMLSRLSNGVKYTVKAAGGASKVSAIVRLLVEENINAIILLDDDNEGRAQKQLILEKLGKQINKTNVMTLKDLVKTLPSESTIEDLLPSEFVIDFFEKFLNQKFSINNDKPILIELKKASEQLNNKEKLNSLKLKLASQFCSVFNRKEDLIGHIKVTEFVEEFNLRLSRLEPYTKIIEEVEIK